VNESTLARWRLERLVPLYVIALIVLAVLGANNQARFNHQWDLLDRKALLQEEITILRQQAATISGPLAVANWARENGMVPAPEVEETRHVLYDTPPARQTPATGLTVRTAWQ